jgi:hypothetical protein
MPAAQKISKTLIGKDNLRINADATRDPSEPIERTPSQKRARHLCDAPNRNENR